MADETPMVAVVNCDLLGANGAPATILRPMDADELKVFRTDQAEHAERAAAAEAAPLVLTIEEKLAGALDALPDGPVSKKDLADVIATLRGDA